MIQTGKVYITAKMKQEMGEVQTKKLATLFDKFSAVHLKQGIEPEICECSARTSLLL